MKEVKNNKKEAAKKTNENVDVELTENELDTVSGGTGPIKINTKEVNRPDPDTNF